MQMMTDSIKATPRVFLVEDEYLIRMLLEDMLADLGYAIAAAVGTIAEASDVAATAQFDVAILDVNVGGQEIYPVADILAKRGLPFVFVTGYGAGGMAEGYRDRPVLQKPFQTEQIKATLAGLLSQ
jgi:CheY-like chemotaxis protein